MFKNLKKSDFIVTFILILFVSIVSYYYVNNQARNKLWLKTYPIRASLSKHQLNCSENSPKWLKDLLIYQVEHGNALSNEIVYIDEKEQLYHCENGYMGQYPILSKPITPNTRFRYASITKLWTSDAILDLIKEGKLSFDTRLDSILTEIKNPKDQRIHDITIRHLLLHRAGFNRYSIFGNDMFNIGSEICPNNLERLNNISLDFTPNEKMSYSNLGYCLLGEVISRIYKKPYTNIINEKYQLNHTNIKFIKNHAEPDEVFYNYIETDITGIGDIYTAFNYQDLSSAAGLSGNAIDLAKQIQNMVKKPLPNILSLDNKVPCEETIPKYCFGYAMFANKNTQNGKVIYYRDGKLAGLNTLASIDDSNRILIILSNGESQNNNQLILKIFNILSKIND